VALALVAGGYFRPSVGSILAGTATEVVGGDAPEESADDEEAYKDRD